jgi:hypothetical protein
MGKATWSSEMKTCNVLLVMGTIELERSLYQQYHCIIVCYICVLLFRPVRGFCLM